MKVSDVVIMAAVQLGIGDSVKAYVNGTSSLYKTQAELLLQCFNLVEKELALDYIPLIKQEDLTVNNGKLAYESFGSDVVRIIKVVNKDGVALPYKLFASYMEVDAEKVCVTYAYTPKVKLMTEESDFQAFVSERLFSYGMAAEYCMATGMCEDAVVWDKKYKEGIEAARRLARGGRMPSRGWS